MHLSQLFRIFSLPRTCLSNLTLTFLMILNPENSSRYSKNWNTIDRYNLQVKFYVLYKGRSYQCSPQHTSVLTFFWCGNGEHPKAFMWLQTPPKSCPPSCLEICLGRTLATDHTIDHHESKLFKIHVATMGITRVVFIFASRNGKDT